MAPKDTQPIYLFDLYGVIEVLSSSSNLALNAFAEGLGSGTVKIMSAVSRELKDTDDGLYKKFQALKPSRVYQPTAPAHVSAQAALMEKFGTGWFGGSPTPEHFESVAVCKVEKLVLVTAAKGLGNCKSIAKKCGLPGLKVLSVAEFASQA